MNYDISCNRIHTARWYWFTFMNYHSKLSQNSSLVNNHNNMAVLSSTSVTDQASVFAKQNSLLL